MPEHIAALTILLLMGMVITRALLVRMKAMIWFVLSFIVAIQIAAGLPGEARTEIACGQIITEDTTLQADLACPPGTESAIIIGASNITLDLGGHTVSGDTPGNGVFAIDQAGIIIRNGIIDGFNYGVFVINTSQVTMENLTVRNLDVSDPSQFIFGIHILSSQNILVRDSLFEFLSVPHKEAVEIFDSNVDVNSIEVRGGGAGVSFSFAGGVCDPVNSPSNGTVHNSRFDNIYIAGIWISCSSNALIEGNHFSPAPGTGIGIQGDAPFLGAVTGLTIKDNFIHDTMMGIEFRGISESTILNNAIFDNQIWGIAVRQSLGCLTPEPGWECFYSTANVIADNETWGNGADLYHYENSTGNTWERNTCETKQGIEIPDCTPPHPVLMINYANGAPGSFFTLEGANFPTNSTAVIIINDYNLGAVPTDSSGNLTFLLNTDQADKGEYLVTASVNPIAASVSFVLDAQRMPRPQEGIGTIFNVPGGLNTRFVYLPLILRERNLR